MIVQEFDPDEPIPNRVEELARYVDEHTMSRLLPRILTIEELLGSGNRGRVMEMLMIAVRNAAERRARSNAPTPADARTRSLLLLSAARGLWDKLWGAAALPRRRAEISET